MTGVDQPLLVIEIAQGAQVVIQACQHGMQCAGLAARQSEPRLAGKGIPGHSAPLTRLVIGGIGMPLGCGTALVLLGFEAQPGVGCRRILFCRVEGTDGGVDLIEPLLLLFGILDMLDGQRLVVTFRQQLGDQLRGLAQRRAVLCRQLAGDARQIELTHMPAANAGAFQLITMLCRQGPLGMHHPGAPCLVQF